MESILAKAEDPTLKVAENEVTAVLIHLKKLLRIKNQLRSPLLQLPAETIIHLLSYVMEDVERARVWQPIFSTCHRIHRIMRTATELWWKVDCTQSRVAHIVFSRSRGDPQVIIADFNPWHYSWNQKARKTLDYWRDKQALRGHRLHTLELSGDPPDLAHFSWIFEHPLPRLRHLKIRFFGPLDEHDEGELPIPDLVALQLPMDLPLQTLDLNNATLPWSSTLFAGLRELRLDFKDCETVVDISADELLGVFDASPRLESLSLIQLRPRIPVRNGESQYAPTRIAQLPNLAFLKLDNSPESVGYTLIHMSLPAINSLQIRSYVLLRFFFLTHHLPNRLFPNPPVFSIGDTEEGWPLDSMNVAIGRFEMQLDFDTDLEETIRGAVMTSFPPLVPPSLVILKLSDSKLSEQEWREFLRSHPKIRSIECLNSSGEPTFESLWDALSPAGTDAVPLCPKLESITLFVSPPSAPLLLDCLLKRKNTGFTLPRLKFGSLDDGLVEEFRLLVGELQVVNAPYDSCDSETVRSVLTNRPSLHASYIVY